MKQFNMCDITEHCYHDGTVTRLNQHYFEGIFPEEETKATGLVTFRIYFQFEEVPDILKNLPDVKDADILSFTVTPCENGYDVKLCILAEEFQAIAFQCRNMQCNLYRYKGKSYRNIYNEIDFSEISDYFTDEWYEGEEQISIADDLNMIHKKYIFKKYNAEGILITGHSFGKYQVLKNGIEIYSFVNDDDQVTLKNPLIYHSNGRRYLAFHVGLYGISYLEPDSGEVYNYIPEGCTHDYRLPYGESFIITDIHYDEKSDFVAYGGCYWAGPSEVFVGDLRNPLQYDPHLVRIHELLDPKWEEFDDIDFVRWEEETFVLNCDGKEISVPLDKLRKAFRKEV